MQLKLNLALHRGLRVGMTLLSIASCCLLPTTAQAGITVPYYDASVTASNLVMPSSYYPNNLEMNYPQQTNANSYPTTATVINTGQLQNAIANSTTGSTIVLESGSYLITSAITIPQRLNIVAKRGARPWIKGSISISGTGANGWTKVSGEDLWYTRTTPTTRSDGRNLEYGTFDESSPAPADDYPQAVFGEQVFVNGRPSTQKGGTAAVKGIANTFYVDRSADRLYIGVNPAGKAIEVTASTQAFIFASASVGSTLRGIGFMQFATRGVGSFVRNVLYEDCSFVWNSYQGMKMGNGSGTAAPQVKNCLFACNGNTGLLVGSIDGPRIEGNTFSYNNVESFFTGHSAGGTKIQRATNAIVRLNRGENQRYAIAIWIDIAANDAEVYGNTLINCGVGVYFEISERIKIAFNLFRNNGTAVSISGSDDAIIQNNTFYTNDVSIKVRNAGRLNNNKHPTNPQPVIDDYPLNYEFKCERNVIRNNLYVFGVNSGQSFFDASASNGDGAASMVSSNNHNGFWRANGTPPTSVIKWDSPYATLAAYKNDNANTGTREDNSIADDTGTTPPFDTTTFHLSSGSPARTAGQKWTFPSGAVTPDGQVPVFPSSGTSCHLGAFNVSNVNVAPSVSLSSPTSGAVFSAAAAPTGSFTTRTVAATASDPNGAGDLNRVEFRLDDQLVSSDTTAPFEATLSNLAVGNYTVSARAFDDAGAASTLDSATFSVKQAINAGSETGAGSGNNVFTPDSQFSGTSLTYTTTNVVDVAGVSNAAPATVYQSERYDSSDFFCTLNSLTPGETYTVRLHFAETLGTIGLGDRLFNVQINGADKLSNFDIYSAAGNTRDKAVVRAFPGIVADSSGRIGIRFVKLSNQNPKVCGVEVLK